MTRSRAEKRSRHPCGGRKTGEDLIGRTMLRAIFEVCVVGCRWVVEDTLFLKEDI